MKAGRITISDRASAGVYQDLSGEKIEIILRKILPPGIEIISAVVPDDKELIESMLKRFSDKEHCQLIVTTGGTGITERDVTPEATRAVLDKELPGFGEIMRIHSYKVKKTAILSRAIAGVRRNSLIINLPGNPESIEECMMVLSDAIIEALEHLAGRDPHKPQPVNVPAQND